MLHHEKVAVLAHIPFFSDLSPITLDQLALATTHREYLSGETLFLEGEPCAGLYFVLAGWLRAVKISPSGREQVIRFVGPMDTFNEIGVLSGGVNKITVEALEPSELLIINRSALLSLIDHHPAFAKSIVQNLANRVLHAMDLIVNLSLHPVESRLARFLLDEAAGDTIQRKSWATQATIAARVGTVPVVVNRAFRSLVEANIIVLDRDRIEIIDRPALEEIAGITS